MKEGDNTKPEGRRAVTETEVERVATETEELRILEETKRKEFDQSLFEGLEEM